MVQKSFWITNISGMNVSLRDLNLTIKAYTSINLLDNKHYKYTLEELQKSVEKGSIFSKRNKIFVRKNAPEIDLDKSYIYSAVDAIIPGRERSVMKIQEEYYEELSFADDKLAEEKYAEENAEFAEMDEKPTFTNIGDK